MVSNFYGEIEKRGFSDLLRRVEYKTPVFDTLEQVANVLLAMIAQDAKTIVCGDYDIDGLMCALTVSQSLRKFGMTKVDVFRYSQRTHNLDQLAVHQCIQGKYDCIVVCDTGSNDISALKKLRSYGVAVIVLDHHNSAFTYSQFEEEGISIVNTTLERQKFALSAGALCYCVMDYVAQKLQVDLENLVVFAAISLFSDCMNMSDTLNRAIYYKAVEVSSQSMPVCVSLFMNAYTKFNARFINFWFAPRINAMFRSENFEPVNLLFFDGEQDASVCGKCLEIINSSYETIRDLVGKVTDTIDVKELDNFVIADLASVDQYYSVEGNKLYNYTGLVANKLADRFRKTAVVLCRGPIEYKGSVRDCMGRNYLSVFQQLCYAGGHNAAFGIRVKNLDFDDFMCALYRVDKYYSIDTVPNEPIVVEYSFGEPDESLIEDVATFNEFAGQEVPIVLLRKQIVGSIREQYSEYYYKYSWGSYSIQSNHSLPFGSFALLKPFHSWCTKLLVT